MANATNTERRRADGTEGAPRIQKRTVERPVRAAEAGACSLFWLSASSLSRSHMSCFISISRHPHIKLCRGCRGQFWLRLHPW
jgi:hypothetical protein